MNERVRGRPRSIAARAAVLDAALRLCAEQGYAQVTMKGIADAAGVGRQTVYRWWPTKADVLLEAIRDLADRELPRLPLTGDALHDVRVVLDRTFQLTRELTSSALVGLMADAQHDQVLSDRLQSTLIGPRRDALREIIDRGITDGQLHRAVRPALVVDLVFGTMWYRLISKHGPIDAKLARELTDVVRRLLAA